MSRKKPGWTEPGPVIDQERRAELRAAEERKGTAAANPVLSLAPKPPEPGRRRPGAGASAAAGSGASAVRARPGTSDASVAARSARSGASAVSGASAWSGASAVDGSGGAPDARSPAEIEAEIERTRQRLADTLDELSERLSPRAVLRRADSSLRDAFVAEDGSVRRDRAALAIGAVVSAVGGVVALRKLRR